jgi:hypothetical protein
MYSPKAPDEGALYSPKYSRYPFEMLSFLNLNATAEEDSTVAMQTRKRFQLYQCDGSGFSCINVTEAVSAVSM